MHNKVEVVVGVFVLGALMVVAYMGLQIGAFRFDQAGYYRYNLLFNDVSGLSRKALVKIAGVEVGWVEAVQLVREDLAEAQVIVMINHDFVLHSNACAMVRQDGFLGSKYIEIIPGDPLLPRLLSGSTLTRPASEQVSMDEILHQVQLISNNIQEVTQSLKEAVGGNEGARQLKEMVHHLAVASEKIASFSTVIDNSVSGNRDNIDALLQIGRNVQRISERLDQEVLPAFADGVKKITSIVDRDFSRVADKLESSIGSLGDASSQARDDFKCIGSIAEKIDEGKGLVGRLINEDETYRDLKVTVKGLKNYMARLNMLEVVFDTHFEGMFRPAENYCFEDNKGYFDIRIHPNDDHFYLVELTTSERGLRYEQDKEYQFACGDQLIDLSSLDLKDKDRLRWQYQQNRTKYMRNTVLFGIQFGKVFENIALRFGIFDGYFAGAAVDIDIPFETDKLRWLMSFEGYDFRGWNRKDDRRPHLKWLNKVYILRNLYAVFGADDFISRHNANVFFGAGLRFSDEDIKFILPSLSGARSFNSFGSNA